MTPEERPETTAPDVLPGSASPSSLQLVPGDVLELVVDGTSRRFMVVEASPGPSGERAYELIADPENP